MIHTLDPFPISVSHNRFKEQQVEQRSKSRASVRDASRNNPQLFSALDFWGQLWIFYTETPSVYPLLPLNLWQLFAATLTFTEEFQRFLVHWAASFFSSLNLALATICCS